MCTSLRLSGISKVSQETGLNSLESQLRLIVVLGFLHSLYILPEVIEAICGVHSLRLSRISTVSQGEGLNSMESQLRMTVVLGFLHSLYILPEVIVAISGVHLSVNFRYF